jgi:hypothetical protein
MTPITTLSEEALKSETERRILCFYTNSTDRVQIIRITNSPNLQLERVVFPRQQLLFESVAEAQLEIQTSEVISLLVPCSQLRVLTHSDKTLLTEVSHVKQNC